MQVNFKWKNPPVTGHANSKKTEPHFLETARKLIANPNKWARIATTKSSQWVRLGLNYSAIELGASGHFEYTTKKLPDGARKFWARWVEEVL